MLSGMGVVSRQISDGSSSQTGTLLWHWMCQSSLTSQGTHFHPFTLFRLNLIITFMREISWDVIHIVSMELTYLGLWNSCVQIIKQEGIEFHPSRTKHTRKYTPFSRKQVLAF